MPDDNTVRLTLAVPAWGYAAGGALLWYALAAAAVRYGADTLERLAGNRSPATENDRVMWFFTSPVSFPILATFLAIKWPLCAIYAAVAAVAGPAPLTRLLTPPDRRD